MKKMVMLIFLTSLTGCGTNQQFDCPITEGVRCQSVSEVDKLVDAGKIGKKTRNCSKSFFNFKAETAVFNPPEPALNPCQPLRTQEEVIQIWVAAYEGEDGIYHEPSVLNTVLRSAEWVGAVPEVKEE